MNRYYGRGMSFLPMLLLFWLILGVPRNKRDARHDDKDNKTGDKGDETGGATSDPSNGAMEILSPWARLRR